MRTTLDIDDRLMHALLRRYPDVSKKVAVERAIRHHLGEDAVAGLRALRGKIEIEDVSKELRAVDRRT